ncbi:MAG: cadherin-like beta sandwich domain-containing protein, partial [Prevotellaceae bacterium]|nr:cadherin-like beta sandwich domain-containing protein [Prevotellaceae bacterium]
SDATLKVLSVSTGTLSPAFNANTTGYTVNVANSVSSITISATANHASATVSGAGSKTLSVGTNTFDVTVTAQNCTTTKTYTVTVTRAAASASSDATLKVLSVSTGTLSPAFNANTTGYTVNVANSVSSITISATANHASATVSGAGSNKNLSVGENVFDVTVIAQDGTTTKTYTLTITRAAASTEVSPTLSALVVSNGVLSPTFSPAVTSYTVEVPNSVSSITLTAVSESGVTVTGAGTKPLSVGENTFNITVQSGSNLKTYTVRVTRLSLSTSVEGELQAEVSLYPNPFAGALHLTGAVGCTLTVVSTGGAAVHTQKVTSATETIRLKNLPSGIYFLRLEKDGKVKTVKAVKQ